MRTKFGALVVSGSGKLGGQAFSQTGSRPKLSGIAFGKRKRIPGGGRANTAFSINVRRWRALTQQDRDSWNNHAPPGLSGFNLYVQSSVNFQLFAMTAAAAYVQSNVGIRIDAFNLVAASGAQSIISTASISTFGGFRAILFLSQQQSPGKSINSRGLWASNQGLQNTTLVFNVGAAYTARYGTLKAGKKIFYKVVCYSSENGLEVTSLSGSTIVT